MYIFKQSGVQGICIVSKFFQQKTHLKFDRESENEIPLLTHLYVSVRINVGKTGHWLSQPPRVISWSKSWLRTQPSSALPRTNHPLANLELWNSGHLLSVFLGGLDVAVVVVVVCCGSVSVLILQRIRTRNSDIVHSKKLKIAFWYRNMHLKSSCFLQTLAIFKYQKVSSWIWIWLCRTLHDWYHLAWSFPLYRDPRKSSTKM